ncbi:MAG: cupin domain-containing protein, partial [Acidimicrobiales bacterium]
MSSPSTTTLDALPADAVAAVGIDAVPEHADPLAEALHYLRMDGMFYCRSELTAPWGIELPPMPDCLWFHVVASGRCTLVDADGNSYELQQGDIAVLPHGGGHRAFDSPDSST